MNPEVYVPGESQYPERETSWDSAFSNPEKARQLTRRVLWKLDLYILPPLALLWLANFIDRSNVGNARIAGLEKDLHLGKNQFNQALTVFYVPYILSELPSNWVLKKLRPSRWLPLLVALWGTVTTLTGLVQNFSGLVAIRFFLGLCEGGLLPGIILYLSTMYRPHELQLRVGIFYASASLSGAFGGLLATVIIKMNGVAGLEGWRWIFILEGIATVLIAVLSWISMPADLSRARFFTNEERAFALHRFRESQAIANGAPLSEPSQRIVTRHSDKALESDKQEDIQINAQYNQDPVVNQEDEKFEWREVVRGILDAQVWLTAIAYFGILVSLYSISLFLPTIVTGLGYSGGKTQLHTVPPYVPAAFFTVLVAVFSDKYKARGPFMLFFLLITIIGYIIAIVAKTNSQRYIAVHLVTTGVYPSVPCVLSILPNNCAGHYKKATAIALQLAIANCGGFVATFAYTSDQAPKFKKGHSIALGFVCVAWIFTALNVAYCVYENRARQSGRRDGNYEKYQELLDSRKTRAPIGDRSPAFLFTL